MEATLCIRAYFETQKQCSDVIEILNDDTRPLFDDGLSTYKSYLFAILEFSDDPESIQLCADISIYATWFVGSEDSIETLLKDLIKCKAKDLFALVDADDYCEFYKLDSKRLILTRDVEMSELTTSEIELSSEKLLEKEFDLLSCEK